MDEIQKSLIKFQLMILFLIQLKNQKLEEDHFDWAFDYVYGIEKDYRLVKTAKVGYYLQEMV